MATLIPHCLPSWVWGLLRDLVVPKEIETPLHQGVVFFLPMTLPFPRVVHLEKGHFLWGVGGESSRSSPKPSSVGPPTAMCKLVPTPLLGVTMTAPPLNLSATPTEVKCFLCGMCLAVILPDNMDTHRHTHIRKDTKGPTHISSN